jgi:formate-dependent nitrite reductase membrane component NrfD
VIPLQAAQVDDQPVTLTGRKPISDLTFHRSNSGANIRSPIPQGLGGWGPIFSGGRLAEHMLQTTYNAQHQIPWHWPVPAYLVTKAIGSGILALLALFFGLEWVNFSRPLAVGGSVIALLAIGLTTLLLIIDLDKPSRFYTILTRPQWQSWLTRGAFILLGFSASAGLWLLIEGAVWLRLLPFPLANTLRPFLLVVSFVCAVGSAGYSAFLFGQAEGRDLWQSSLLPFHLLVQAFMVGAAVLLWLGFFATIPGPMVVGLAWIFGVTLVLDLGLMLWGELGVPHALESAARAAHTIRAGRYRWLFWWGSIGLGHVLPLFILLISALLGALPFFSMAIAMAATIVGLYLYEYAFVMAPQQIPNS